MLIDSFLFLNEIELLQNRIKYLYDVVDYFAIIESDYTFNGKQKELIFSKNINKFSKYFDKILYFPCPIDITQFDTNDPEFAWEIESFQRNYIKKVSTLFQKDDIMILGDVDEIPTIEAIHRALNSLIREPAAVFLQELFYYNFNQSSEELWCGTVIFRNRILDHYTPQTIRTNRNKIPIPIVPGGYHLSYWNTPENISYKIQSFSHQEFNTPEITNPNNISERIKKGLDVFNRPEVKLNKVNKESIDPLFYNIFNIH